MTALLSQLIELNAKTERILEFRHNPFGRSEKEMDQQDEQGKKYGGKGLAIAGASGLGAYGIKKAHDLGKMITEGKGGMAENVFTGLVAAPQIAATRVSEKLKSIKKGLRKLGRKIAMSSNHENLVNLNSKIDDLIEFRAPFHDSDGDMLGVGGAYAGTGLAAYGLHRRGKFIPLEGEELRGMTSRNIARINKKGNPNFMRNIIKGAQALPGDIRRITKLSARHERLVNLNAKVDQAIEMSIPKGWKIARRVGPRPAGKIPEDMRHGWPNEAQQLIADSYRGSAAGKKTYDAAGKLIKPKYATPVFRDDQGAAVYPRVGPYRLKRLSSKLDDLLEFGLASGGTTAAARNAIWAAERKAGVPRGKMSFFRKRDSKEVKRRKATSLPIEVWPKEMQPYLNESADRDLGLFSALDTNLIELGRYDEDYGDRRMLGDAALGVGALGTGIGLLYARNRGDKINKAKYEAGIGKAKALTAGQFGPAIPTAEQYAGGTGRAIGTGLKDIYKSIMSKISIPALARNIKASARLERLVNLNAKTDSLVQFDDYGMIGAGLIGGAGLYGGSYLNDRGAGIKVNKREARNYAMNNIPRDTPEPEIKKRLAAYVEKPGLMRNMRVGASDAIKSLSKKIR